MTKPQFNIRALIGLDDSPRSDPAAITWTDVTEWLRLRDGVSLSTGRQDETSHVGVGLASCAFNNSDGRFTPENTDGAWYPRFKHRRPLRLERCRYDAESLLAQAVLWLDANYATSGQTVPNLGSGGSALDGRLGSTVAADSNDPTFLAYSGTPYVYLPGGSNNFISQPDAAPLRITGDLTLIFDATADDWTDATAPACLGKYVNDGNLAYALRFLADAKLRFSYSTTGGSPSSVSSTATITATNGERRAVAVTIDVDNGAGGWDARFWQAATAADLRAGNGTQVGSTVTTGGSLAFYAGTAPLYVGRQDSGVNFTGKVHRAMVISGIGPGGAPTGGTVVSDIDCSVLTSGSAMTFTEQSPNAATVTINRLSAGRKSVAVVAPLWLLGTDDYIEVADADLLDFGASDSFTVLAVVRQWATPASFVRYVSKYGGSGAGWELLTNGSGGIQSDISDGTNSASRNNGTIASGSLSAIGMRVDRAGNTIGILNGNTAFATTGLGSVASMSNSLALRIGTRAGSAVQYGAFELVAVAVFRRALTAAQVEAIASYFQSREASTSEGLRPFSPLWTGYIEQIVEGWDNGVQPIARIRAVDAMAFLARQDSTLRALAVEELAHDAPALLYPLNDSAGATAAGDQSTSRNATLAVAQAGTGGTAMFGQASGLGADPDEPCLVLTRVDASNGKYLTQTFNPLPALSGLTGVTLEGLVYLPVSVPGTVRAFELARYASFDLLAVDLVSDAPRAIVTIGGTTVTTSAASAINDGAWHHLAVTYDGANLRLWVDGVNVQTAAAALGTFTGNILTVGATNGATQLANGWFAGIAAHATALPTDRMVARGAIVTGAAGDTSQERFDRVARLALGAWAESTSTATPAATMCAQPWAGQRPSTLLNQIADAERAPVYISGAGIPVWLARSERAPSGAPLEIQARQVDSSTGFSTSNFGLVNVAEYTRPGGARVRVSDQASIDDHEKTVDTATIFVDSDEQLTAAANATVNARKTPKRRAGALTVDLVTNANIADELLDLEVSDVLRVTDLPSGSVTQLDVFLEGWTDTITDRGWARTWNTSPLRSGGQVWRLGDPVYSKLGVTTILG